MSMSRRYSVEEFFGIIEGMRPVGMRPPWLIAQTWMAEGEGERLSAVNCEYDW